jgi:thiamine-phosphate pyrophosphorylase
MPDGQPLPRIWLVTDERQGEKLLPAIAGLPPISGILFRHYSLEPAARQALFDRVRAQAAGAGHLLLLAGPPDFAASWGADGWHGRHEGAGLHSESVHDADEIQRAEANGADLLFLSPVFATRSHPGGVMLGVEAFARLVRLARRPVIALGGVNANNAPQLLQVGAYGWAGVDAWTH